MKKKQKKKYPKQKNSFPRLSFASEHLWEANRQDDGFFESCLGTFQSGNIFPSHIGLLSNDGSLHLLLHLLLFTVIVVVGIWVVGILLSESLVSIFFFFVQTLKVWQRPDIKSQFKRCVKKKYYWPFSVWANTNTTYVYSADIQEFKCYFTHFFSNTVKNFQNLKNGNIEEWKKKRLNDVKRQEDKKKTFKHMEMIIAMYEPVFEQKYKK